MSIVSKAATYLDFYATEKLVGENEFIAAPKDRSFPPDFSDVKHLLPQPHWDGHGSSVDSYWKAWQLAFKNIRRVHVGNGFIAPYVDTAFNDCLFMWDSCFILMFGKYGQRAFNFQQTLDNLYAKQHADGFISREVTQWSGQDRFHRYDPASTGPNILAWCEWEYFLKFNDIERLRKVFPVLLAYHKWCRRFRTWPDGSYHSSGLACGMDNQPRVSAGHDALIDHSHMAWIDACCQAVISARLLTKMAKALGRVDDADIAVCVSEQATLSTYIQEKMWHPEKKMYFDRILSGDSPHLSDTTTIGAYWALLADTVPADRLSDFASHLDDPEMFNRSVRTPSLAHNHAAYEKTGGYWLGGVWPSTNYMLLRGLTHVGYDDIAADVAFNYHSVVTTVFEKTGTHWENLAPELNADGEPIPGDPAKGDFVGWGGIGPISVLFEYVFGIRADVPRGVIRWDIRLTDAFGVDNYPFGPDGCLSLHCAARAAPEEEPVVTIKSNLPLKIELFWGKTASAVGGVLPELSARSKPVLTKEIIVTPSAS